MTLRKQMECREDGTSLHCSGKEAMVDGGAGCTGGDGRLNEFHPASLPLCLSQIEIVSCKDGVTWRGRGGMRCTGKL